MAIVNPVSGRRDRLESVNRIGAELRAAGATLDIVTTERSGHATEIAASLPSHVDAVLIVGGDGTVSEVIDGLYGRDVAFVILGTGTENLLARELEMPTDLSAIAMALLHGAMTPLDLGDINGRRFVAIFGAGFDGACIASMAGLRTGHISRLSYVRAIWQAWRSYPFPLIRVEVDGVFFFEGRGVVNVGLIRRYGGGVQLLARADPSDGLLDVLVFPCVSPLALLAHFLRCFFRRHLRRRGVRYAQVARVRVSSRENVPVQIDGDVAPPLPADIRILPGAVKYLRFSASL